MHTQWHARQPTDWRRGSGEAWTQASRHCIGAQMRAVIERKAGLVTRMHLVCDWTLPGRPLSAQVVSDL